MTSKERLCLKGSKGSNAVRLLHWVSLCWCRLGHTQGSSYLTKHPGGSGSEFGRGWPRPRPDEEDVATPGLLRPLSPGHVACNREPPPGNIPRHTHVPRGMPLHSPPPPPPPVQRVGCPVTSVAGAREVLPRESSDPLSRTSARRSSSAGPRPPQQSPGRHARSLPGPQIMCQHGRREAEGYCT